MMNHRSDTLVSTQHPSLAGHFPGNPVVPGVVILDEVIGALQQWQPQWQVGGFVSVKFLSPLLPEQNFSIELQQHKPARVKFKCLRQQSIDKQATGDQNVFASGEIITISN